MELQGRMDVDIKEKLAEIEESLTGDRDNDVEFLLEKLEKLDAQDEIREAVADLIVERYVKQPLQQMEDSLKQTVEAYGKCYEKAQSLAGIGMYEEALREIDDLVRQMILVKPTIHGKRNDYYCFSEWFERDLFIEVEQSTRMVWPHTMPLTKFFTLHGSLLTALERYEEGITSLSMAVLYGPADHEARILLAEAYKRSGNPEMVRELTMKGFRYAFRNSHFTELYFTLGCYFGMMEQWDDVMACLALSKQFGGNRRKDLMFPSMHQLERHAGRRIQEPDMDQIRRSAEANGYPIGPDRSVLMLARRLGEKAYMEGRFDRARYYYGIAHELFHEEADKSVIDALSEQPVLM